MSANSTRAGESLAAGVGRRAPARAISASIVDVDSFVGRGLGTAKQGAAYGYTGKRGYHPILATRADTGEVLDIRAQGLGEHLMGCVRFVDELIAAGRSGRRDRPEAACEPTRGFGTTTMMAASQRAGWSYSIGVRKLQSTSRRRIAHIPEDAPGSHAEPTTPKSGEAQIAETRPRRPADDRPAHPPARRASRAVARLAALRVRDQPHRRARTRRGRTPPARRRRARDPRSQRPSPRALPIGPLHGQRRLDGDRRARAQPAALDRADRPARPDTIRAARTLRRRLLTIPGRLTRSARAGRCVCPPAGPGKQTSSGAEHDPSAPRRLTRHDRPESQPQPARGDDSLPPTRNSAPTPTPTSTATPPQSTHHHDNDAFNRPHQTDPSPRQLSSRDHRWIGA